MGESKAGIQSCVAINKKNDDRLGTPKTGYKEVDAMIASFFYEKSADRNCVGQCCKDATRGMV
jgi:hypothetical protein